jgi:hypothetical protein
MPSRFSKAWAQQWKKPEHWKRAIFLGGTVGLIQVAINQGDKWLNYEINSSLVVKSVASPLVTFSVAFLSGIFSSLDQQKNEQNKV